MEYTIRHIPGAVDSAIRSRARATGKSLNETLVDALSVGAGVADSPWKRRDLSDIAGSWKRGESFDSALDELNQVDYCLWN